MIFSGIDKSSVSGAVKDIAGTIIDAAVLFVAFKALLPKKSKSDDFDNAFKIEMDELIKKYSPVISFYGIEDDTKTYMGYSRYNIANNLDAIATNNAGGNNKFFRIKSGITEIEFSVSATLFKERKEAVASLIASKICISYQDFLVAEPKLTKDGFALSFKNPLSTADDAKKAAEIIDNIVLLYIVEYKVK